MRGNYNRIQTLTILGSVKKNMTLDMPSTRGTISKTEACVIQLSSQAKVKDSTSNGTLRLAWSAKEVAQLLGLSTRSLKRLEDRHLLRPIRALRCKRYLHTDLLKFLEESK